MMSVRQNKFAYLYEILNKAYKEKISVRKENLKSQIANQPLYKVLQYNLKLCPDDLYTDTQIETELQKSTFDKRITDQWDQLKTIVKTIDWPIGSTFEFLERGGVDTNFKKPHFDVNTFGDACMLYYSVSRSIYRRIKEQTDYKTYLLSHEDEREKYKIYVNKRHEAREEYLYSIMSKTDKDARNKKKEERNKIIASHKGLTSTEIKSAAKKRNKAAKKARKEAARTINPKPG